VTGLTLEQDLELNARQVQFLKEYVPELKRLGALRDPRYPGLKAYVDVMAQAARKLDVAFELIDVTGPDGLEAAFAALAKLNVQAHPRPSSSMRSASSVSVGCGAANFQPFARCDRPVF
jgi:hypothetical protein